MYKVKEKEICNLPQIKQNNNIMNIEQNFHISSQTQKINYNHV